MVLPPQKFREIVFQLLFSSAFNGSELESTAIMLMKELKVTKKTVLEACDRSRQILSHLVTLDAKIGAVSTNYKFERISSAEKCALRLGLFELFHDPSLPPKVVIAEAIRLTRKFGTSESANFVNAILDTVFKNEFELATQPTS